MTKERQAELIKRLRDAAKQQDPIARAVVDLVALLGVSARERLVEALGADMLREQGAARQLNKLHKDLTIEPHSIGLKERE